MESEVAFIQTQLWIVIGLLVLFIVSNILCRVFGCGERKEDDFGDLWDKGEVDEVLRKAESRLLERPHDIGALYFGARAMIARGRNLEARALLQRLSVLEPSFRQTCADEIEALDRILAGS